MEEKIVIEELSEKGFTRRELVKKAAAAGVGLSALGTLLVEEASARTDGLDVVRWVSPRGTLEVMDDYNLVVPIKMGYFRRLGIDARLNGGPGRNEMQLIAAKQMDMGYASPGVMTAAIDAGVPVISIWEQYPAQVFDFVLPGDSKITHPRQLKGKTISVFTIGWKPIVDPMLAEVGVDPKTVKYREFGPQWVQAVALKLVDAGLAWEGLRAQLLGMAGVFGSGFNLKFLVGTQWGSKLPSNSYQVRRADLDDPKRRDIYTRFLAGVVMGFEFARANPRAAAQITYEQYPGLQKLITPQVALESLMQLASGYHTSRRKPPHLYGWHYPNDWKKYLDFIFKFKQIKQPLTVEDVLTNDLVRPANAKADKARAVRDAKAFKLNQAFQRTTIPKGLPL
jgi:NitT/TauT family transport system substrate-binding protein